MATKNPKMMRSHMTSEVADLRKGDRFEVVEPVTGSFGPAEIAVLNLSLRGAQISHPQPLRIGTRGKLWFKRGDVTVTIQATVVWSHLLRSTSGTMAYRTGVRLDSVDAPYALAINTMMRNGIIRQDVDSMNKKRARLAEREEQRKSQLRIVPSSEPPLS
jgi:hypothetical protein